MPQKSGKIRLLITTGIYPPSIGGPATYSKLLFDELPANDIEVGIVSFDSVRRFPKIIRHFFYFLLAIKNGRKHDLLYALDPVSVGLPTFFASKILRKKYIIRIAGDYAWEQFNQQSGARARKFVTLDEFQNKKFDFFTELRRYVQKFVTTHAEKVIVPSEYLKGIVTIWGVQEEKIKVIYNAFTEKINIDNSKEDLKNILNLKGRVVISAGRLVPWKGFDALIGLMIPLIKKFPDIILVIIGDGPDEARLEKTINLLNLEKKVFLLGRLSQEILSQHIKASDVFVLNTAYEGLSHQLLEVMAIGTPIITTDVGGNPETIENNKEGFIVKYGDKKALERSIEKVLTDDTIAMKFSENAFQKVKMFSKDNMINKLICEIKNINLK
ncbi:MAG: glycosyltransferase family 4 protein [Candidatus Paceibacterota bacterium]